MSLTLPVLNTPRLLKGAYGWWYLGTSKPVRLGPAAVDERGNLRPEVARQIDSAGVNNRPSGVGYALTVLTATTCNLGCGYCFQNVGPDVTGGHRPPRIGAALLTRSTAARILRFASDRMAESGLDQLHLHLFGGEPLLNPKGCRDLLELAADHGLTTARMTSNGTLLTRDLARELAELGLGRVQITFDGDRTTHDATRVTRTGGSTFDVILANMAAATEATGLRWDLRVNVSERNRDRVTDLLEQIARRVDPARCHIDFALLYDAGVGYSGALRPGADLAEEAFGWTVAAVELGFGIYRPKANEACQSCTVRDGRLGAVVNADGTLYSCWSSAGKPGWEVGRADTGYLPADQVDGRWVSCDYVDRRADAAATTEFRDALDARVLDFLHARGRLTAPPS
ncbi:MAG: radical SAM protein [Micromonosporaceae bacterium]